MMLRYTFLLLAVLWKAIPSLASGLNFQPLKTIQPLPTNEVRNLYQDSQGYIWIATYNGLLRYDGYSILPYRPDAHYPARSVDGFVNIVREDGQRRLWIGTHNGLYVLDKAKDCITKVTLSGLRAEGSYIEAVACARNGDVWVGTAKGLYRRHNTGGEFTLCNPSGELNIKYLMEDRRGQLWIGTWGQGLWRYDVKSGRFFQYKGLNPANSAHVIFQDSGGAIWVGTWRYGLVRIENPYDMDHYSYVRYRHNAGATTSIADDIIYSITEDANTGKLWIGSRSGLSVLEDSVKGVFTNYLPGHSTGDLPFNEVNALLCSRDGMMWIGMLGGGVCTTNTRPKRFHTDALDGLRAFCPTSSVRSMCQQNTDEMWMGIMGYGLITYNLKTHKVRSYQEIPAFSALPYISTVNEIIRLKHSHTYCFATWDDGVWLYDGQRVRVIDNHTYPQLHDVCIYSVLEDSHGNLWIGSRSGLFMLDQGGKLHSLSQLIHSRSEIPASASVFKLVEDGRGNVWAATPSAGIWHVVRSNGMYQLKIYSVNRGNASVLGALTLARDAKNRVWAGGNESGICMYDSIKDSFVPQLNEFFEKNEIISCLLTDGQEGLWAASNMGLYRFGFHNQLEKPTVEIYTQEDGLQTSLFNRNSCYKGIHGELYFGGVEGLSILDMNTAAAQTVSPSVVITDFQIYNESVRNMKRTQYERLFPLSPDYAREVEVHSNQNNFSITFSILDFINPELNKYEYKLEGYDRRWIPVTAYHRTVSYNNLTPGRYIFRVKGVNAHGQWTEQERTLAITVLPPLWKTWWAYLLYALSVILAFYTAYLLVRKRVHMKHMIEMGQVERQKLEELNHSKLQFFTNITHELLTPLSIMSALLDEMKWKHPELKHSLADFSVSMTRLSRLIQEILEFRKIENNRQKLKVSQGNLTRFLRHSVAAFTPLVRKKHLHVTFLGDDVEHHGYFDPDKLDKIAYNLLSNAAKYTPEGSTITLTQHYDVSGQNWGFSINNPGDLIPQSKLPHLFERFYEGEYRRFHTSGTGIGLSLAKDLVVLHHGSITADSTSEDGNTFSITIPVGRSAYADSETDESFQTDVSEDDPEGDIFEESVSDGEFPVGPPIGYSSDVIILLVEDNDELRQVLARRLSEQFQVVDVSTAEQALDELGQREVGIVVTDVMMPDIDGFELCRRIKETFETQHIPVILLTACTADVDRVKGYESGADGYLCKPINVEILLAKIGNLLRKQQGAVADARKKLVFEAKEMSYTSRDKEFLEKAVDCVHAHMDDQNFDTLCFATELGMARSTCSDRLKALTGMTPLAFISSIRLQAAFRLMEENKNLRISDLAYAVGFNDPKYFSQCFRKKFGFSPKEYMSGNIR